MEAAELEIAQAHSLNLWVTKPLDLNIQVNGLIGPKRLTLRRSQWQRLTRPQNFHMLIQTRIYRIHDIDENVIEVQILRVVVSHKKLYLRIDFALRVCHLSDAAYFDVYVFVNDAFIALEQGVDVEGLELLEEELLLEVLLEFLCHWVADTWLAGLCWRSDGGTLRPWAYGWSSLAY